MSYLEKETEEILKIKDINLRHERFMSLLFIYIDGQHADLIVRLLKQFINEAETKSDSGYEVVFYTSLAYIYVISGQKELSVACLNKARNNVGRIKSTFAVGMYLLNESILSWFQGKRNDGFDYIFKSISETESTNHHEVKGWARFTLATYQFDSNQLKEAEENYYIALQHFRTLDLKYGYARANNGIASIKIKQEALTEASDILYEIKTIYEDYGKLSGLSRVITDLGIIESKRGNYATALELHESALEMRKVSANIPGQITSLLEIGNALIYLKEYDRAEEMLNQAASLSTQNNFKAKAFLAYELLAKLHKLNHRFEEALASMESYFSFKLQVLTDEGNSRLKVLQTQLLAEESAKREEIEKESNKQLRTAFDIIEQKNTEILQSIDYAKRIQKTILPIEKKLKQHFPYLFVFYKPKDIVAGDFYWMHVKESKVFYAVCDSTGHGVPGAFVSLVCNQALNRAVSEFNLEQPALILDKVNELIVEAFAGNEQEQVNDGMDASLIMVDFINDKIEWAGAHNPLWIVDKSSTEAQLIEIKGDKQPIGKYDFTQPFTNHNIPLTKGNNYFMFSDGFADQFGGTDNMQSKKFSKKRFRELVVDLSSKSIDEQGMQVESVFAAWKGNFEQTDDVLVTGFSF